MRGRTTVAVVAPRVVAAILALLSGTTASAVLFAIAGRFVWWAVLPVGLGLALFTYRYVGSGRAVSGVYWVLAFGVVALSIAFNSLFPADHLLTGRDAGTYVATAGWEMHEAAKDLRFEYAARLRNEIGELKRELRDVTEATL